MKAWLNHEYSESFIRSSSELSEKFGAQLSCEAEHCESEQVIETIIQLLVAWEREILACSLFRGSQWRVCLVSLDELRSLLRNAVDTEEVVSIDDLATAGGCCIDFSPEADGKTEVLLTAWGQHEEMVHAMARRVDGAVVFKQQVKNGL